MTSYLDSARGLGEFERQKAVEQEVTEVTEKS